MKAYGLSGSASLVTREGEILQISLLPSFSFHYNICSNKKHDCRLMENNHWLGALDREHEDRGHQSF